MDTIARRVRTLRATMRKARAPSLLLWPGPNVRYFSGFTGEDGFLLVGQGWATLVTDGRFTEQARIECPRLRRVIRSGRALAAILEVLRRRRAQSLAVEGLLCPAGFVADLNKRLPRPVRLLAGEVSRLREVKDQPELALIARAARVAEKAFTTLVAGGRAKFVGRTERQVAGELEYLMRQFGADKASFDTIVAAGPHAALPHYRPGDTRIRPGQSVLIDWGAVVGGYCSDLTRVVFTGRIPARLAQVYQIVLRAQQAGMSAVRAGATGAGPDQAAREVIAQAGYGDKFGHGLGHGLGLEVHEGPRLGKQASEPLESGMVVTVEPGIYLLGVGGVRIEDDVLVTPGPCRRLSRLPTDLAAMTLR